MLLGPVKWSPWHVAGTAPGAHRSPRAGEFSGLNRQGGNDYGCRGNGRGQWLLPLCLGEKISS